MTERLINRKVKSLGLRAALALTPITYPDDAQRALFVFAPRVIDVLGMPRSEFLEHFTDTLMREWLLQPHKSLMQWVALRLPSQKVEENTALSAAARSTFEDILSRRWRAKENGPNGEAFGSTEHWVPKVPETMQCTSEQANVIQFLGFENEEVFMQKFPSLISQMVDGVEFSSHAGENVVTQVRVKNTIQDTLEFVQKSFALVEQKEISLGESGKRKSGESIVCHSMRVLYYTLSRLAQAGKLPHTEADWIDVCNTALLHDVLEDVDDIAFTKTKAASDSGHVLKLRKRANGDSYVISHPEIKDMQIPLSSRSVHAIWALTHRQQDDVDQQKLRNVAKDSEWEMTEIIKSADKFDNVLTYPLGAAKNWSGMVYKAFEGVGGTGHLLWKALLNPANTDGVDSVVRLFKRANPSHIIAEFPELLYCLGMSQYCQYALQKEWLDEMAHTHNADMRMKSYDKQSRGFPSETEMARGGEMSDWLGMEETLGLLDIRNLFTDVAERVRGGGEPFNMGDIASYDRRVWDFMAQYTAAGLPQMGHGNYPFRRPRTNLDSKAGARSRNATSLEVSGIIYSGMAAASLIGIGTYATLADPALVSEIRLFLNMAQAGASMALISTIGERLLRRNARQMVEQQRVYRPQTTD